MAPKQTEPEKNEHIQRQSITSELQESYLDYAMSVIVSRALPDVRDGLKPVHRRILWAMWNSGLTASAKLRKSAQVVGTVLGSYHPHSDTAVYDALVRLAQDFNLRYPLVTGQGNFGSLDGDGAAAMRYTECRLSKIAEEMLIDIEKETTRWQPNYDSTKQEPVVLPAKLPNLLMNGTVGIAVGMATNIPPHNLTEILDATTELIANPDASIEDIMRHIKGPDFPTGGIIYDKKAILEAYTTGRGGITTRGVAEVVERKKGKEQQDIIITEIPYQVNKAGLIVKIAQLVTDKKIDGIRDIRDESDKDGMRIVIELKNDAVPQKVLNRLYKYTDIQKDFHMNMIALEGGIQPETMSVKDVLEAHIAHRKEVVRRRTEFDLRKARERAHILEGLAKALSDIDRVIATIKKSKNRDDAHTQLIKKFAFSDAQATAILEMRLQTLAALEHQKIIDELAEKKLLIAELESILKGTAKILKIIKDEFADIKKRYGDARRTRVVAHSLKEFREEDLITQEEVIITLSRGGYIKRISPDTFKTQHRGGKGLIGSILGEEDFIEHVLSARTHDNILFFTDKGKVYQTKVYEIPQGTRTSKGKAMYNFIEVPQEERVNALVAYPDAEENGDNRLFMATKNGVVKKTPLSGFSNVRRSGIIAITLNGADQLGWVSRSSGKDEIILTTAQGQAIRFKEGNVRAMGRTAGGVTGIRLKRGDTVSSMSVIKGGGRAADKRKIMVVMERGFAKQTSLSQYKTQVRGGSGLITAKITTKTGSIIAANIITEEEEILAISAKGQIIRTDIKSVRTTARSAQGVKIMSLRAGDKLTGVIIL